jgi:hypothetical protein
MIRLMGIVSLECFDKKNLGFMTILLITACIESDFAQGGPI